MLLSMLTLPVLPMGQYYWDCKIDKRKSETYESHTVWHQIKTGAGFYFPYYTPFGVSWPWEYISFKIILYPEVVEVYLIKISFHSAKSLDISPIYGIRIGKHAWESTVKSSIEEKNNRKEEPVTFQLIYIPTILYPFLINPEEACFSVTWLNSAWGDISTTQQTYRHLDSCGSILSFGKTQNSASLGDF